MSDNPDVSLALDFAGSDEIRVSKGDDIGGFDVIGVCKNEKDDLGMKGFEDLSEEKGKDLIFTEKDSEIVMKKGREFEGMSEEKGNLELVNGGIVSKSSDDVVVKEFEGESGKKGKDLIVFTEDLELVNGGVGSKKDRGSGEDYLRVSRLGEVVGEGDRLGVGCGYDIGDMVWGKVKSHPWWPGHIYDEDLASPSVKRSKREGHILVAFFGDSSYGWFELEELVPFEPNFDEKSRQTNSKTFTRAVEEAIDEVDRRSWLGLACRCRNQYNFRPTDVEGFYDVDVGNNESAGVFSASQIKKARDNFKPSEMILFMKNLALTPMGDGNKSINVVKHRAAALAYRKAKFEEFDETYAQAFGAHPVRPEPKTAADLQRKPSRAPLSGPLVFAEGLGKGKASSKTTKPKDRVEKDKYLFKRRDEPQKSKAQKPKKGKTLSKLSQIDEGSMPTMSGRETTTSVENQVFQTPALDDISPSPSDQPTSVTISVGHNGTKLHAEGSESGKKMTKAKKRPAGQLLSEDTIVSEKKKKKKKQKTKEAGAGFSSDSNQVPAVSGVGASVVKAVGKMSKATSAAALDLKAENHRNDDESKSLPVTSAVEGLLKEQRREDDESPASMPIDLVDTKLMDGSKICETELRKYLGDLRALASDPLHGGVRTSPLVILKIFLKFRSLVYQKSLVSLVPADADSSESDMPKSTSSAGVDNYPIDHVKETLPVRPLKPPSRPEDPTKGGRKRGPSDRQEEIAAKRKKKVTTLKTLATERKLPQMTSDGQRGETKEAAGKLASAKPGLSASNKRTGPPVKLPDPTMLIMKFPPGASLPSSNELKAKFTRFGTLDSSKTRIFWQSYQVRLVYLHKHQAEAALKFASSGTFWNTDVRCSLRDLSADAPDSLNSKVEDASVSASKSRDPGLEQRQTPKLAPLPLQQPSLLKSCLKKSSVDEGSGGGNGSSRGTRVKFVLGGDDESSKTDQLMVGNSNLNNNASFADGAVSSSSSTSHAMDFNSKNIQKVISSSTTAQLPNMPFVPAQYPKVSNNMLFNEGPSRNIHYFNIQPLAPPMMPSTSDVDIAQQMISLLTKCNDVVNSLKVALGYIPYHTL